MQTWRVLIGDVRERLAELPDGSVQTCVTSPPYWGLRDYGVAGQLGLNQTPDDYVREMVGVFREVRRVLRADGTLWLNIGDSYQNAKGQAGGFDPKQPARRHGLRPQDVRVPGLKPKDLVGIPWMLALALRSDGWWLRQDVVWSKPNPIPEPVKDRPTTTHEHVFLLSKSRRYYYDADAVREPLAAKTLTTFGTVRRVSRSGKGLVKADNFGQSVPVRKPRLMADGRHAGANCRSVWTIATQKYPDGHSATFPEQLPDRCIRAGSRPGDVVLDTFVGRGTAGVVALRLGRSFVGIELKPEYAERARTNIAAVAGLFAMEATA